MNKKSILIVSGSVFLIAGFFHLLRAIMSWSLVIANFSIPTSFSYIVGLILLFLSYQSFKLSRNK